MKPDVSDRMCRMFFSGCTLILLFASCEKEDDNSVVNPTVITSTVENITSSSALISGSVTFDGGSAVMSRGFQYGKEDQNIYTYTIPVGAGTGSFNAELTGLERNTKYKVRAFASNEQSTGYGDVLTFTTAEGSPDQYPVTFRVDLTYYPFFDPATQEVYLSGDFTYGWVMPGSNPSYKMIPDQVSDKIFSITMVLDTGTHYYKYFRVIDQQPSWEHGEWDGDPNRTITVSDTMVVNDYWGYIGDDISLLGTWDAGDFEIIMTGYAGLFSEINSGGWLSALNQGIINYYYAYVAGIVKTGDLTYTGTVLCYHETNGEVDAVFWSTLGLLTLSEDRNTLTVYSEAWYNGEFLQQTASFTRK